MVNNAGIEIGKPIPETDDEEFDRLYEDQRQRRLLRHEVRDPGARADARARSSTWPRLAGLAGVPLLGAYCGVEGGGDPAHADRRDRAARLPASASTRSARRSSRPRWSSGWWRRSRPRRVRSSTTLAAQAQGRLGTPEEVAEMAAFLASDDASFVTGAHYILDNALSRGDPMSQLLEGQGRDRHRRRQGHRAGDRRRARRGGRDGGAGRHRRRRRSSRGRRHRRRRGRRLRRARRGAGRSSSCGRGRAARPRSTCSSPTPASRRSSRSWRCRSRSGDRCSSVDLDGVFLCTKHAGAAMAANGGGSIINIASIKAFGGSPATGHYGAAKAGVVSLTKTAALELRGHGVRVNAICPGWVGTDMVSDNKAELESALGVDFDEVDRRTSRAGSASPRRSPGSRCSWRRTARASRPAPRTSSTAARPPRSSDGRRIGAQDAARPAARAGAARPATQTFVRLQGRAASPTASSTRARTSSPPASPSSASSPATSSRCSCPTASSSSRRGGRSSRPAACSGRSTRPTPPPRPRYVIEPLRGRRGRDRRARRAACSPARAGRPAQRDRRSTAAATSSLDELAGRGASAPEPARAATTSRRSSTPRARPASPRARCSRTATCSSTRRWAQSSCRSARASASACCCRCSTPTRRS